MHSNLPKVRVEAYDVSDAPRLWDLICHNRARLIERHPILLSQVFFPK